MKTRSPARPQMFLMPGFLFEPSFWGAANLGASFLLLSRRQ